MTSQMALPTHVEIFMLVSLVCVCLFMFFVNRELTRVDRSVFQVVGQHNLIRDHVTLLGTHVNGHVARLTARLDSVSQKLDYHSSAIEKIEWDSTEDEDDEEEEEEGDDGDDGDDGNTEDDGDDGNTKDDGNTEEGDEEEGDLTMRTLLAHIDSIRGAGTQGKAKGKGRLHRSYPTLLNIEEGQEAKTCTITLCEPEPEQEPKPDQVEIDGDTKKDKETPVKKVRLGARVQGDELEQVKSILKASHVDCRGNRNTLLKKLAVLQAVIDPIA